MRKGLVAAAAALLLAAGGSAVVLLPGDHAQPLATPTPSPTPEPSRTPLLAPLDASAVAPSAAGVAVRLGPLLRAQALGAVPSGTVVDVTSGRVLLATGGDRAAVPASTTKIMTAVAVLSALDPEQRITTRVVQGAAVGDVVLVGAGDPTLGGSHPVEGYPAPARLADLASALHGTVVKRVVVDDTAFPGPRTGPAWKPSYVTDGDVAPVGALAVDEGRTSDRDNTPRTTDPALLAGRELGQLLHVRAVVRGSAPKDAKVLAEVQSPPLADLVERMLTHSDNDLAEALGRQLALSRHQPPTFDGEARALSDVLARVPGVGTVALHDASGLSPLNRLRPGQLAAALRYAAQQPRLAPLLSGLPVAGFDGTLAKRYRAAPTAVAAGVVRAKTGTLTGVSALAGVVRTRDGRLLAFGFLADHVPVGGTLRAQAALDVLAAALAGCGCP